MADTSLSEALGKPTTVPWNGSEYVIEPFDLNDLADLEDALGGDILKLDVRKTRHQLLVLWIVFRRLDPRLSDADRRTCTYKMTIGEAGAMVKASTVNKAETLLFLVECIRISGLYGDKETGPASKNEEAASGSVGASSSPS